ncbi:transposase [Ornithinibacillus gellani]|nr:transposase [Ornithinibacillus gellani]TQS75927.1 transposase [Ornithinibacillus gellani]
MTRKNGIRYSEEEKAKVVKRMMPPKNESVSKISEETGISDVSLYKWRKEARESGVAAPGNGQTSDKWSSEDKFLIVLETYAMNEEELAGYCRQKGLYREQIIAWQQTCMQANGKVFEASKQLNGQLKEEKQRSKTLERDLKKKEKALAEAAALLLLRKKAQAIWGEEEDE